MMKIKEIRKPNPLVNVHYLPEVLKVEDIAKFLRVSSRTVYNWIECHEITAYRLGTGKKGCIRIFKEDFIAFLRSRQQVF